MFGGGERYPVELARAIARRVDCKLVTFGARASSYRDGPLDVTVLPRTVLLRGHPAHPVGRGLMRALRGADVVHGHHLRAASTRIAALAGLPARRQTVVTDHGLGPGWPRVDAHLFHWFLPVSRYSASILKCPASRTTVVYGGADTVKFRPGGGPRQGGILFVGRLTPHKGIDRLIQAVPEGATLTIVGTSDHDRRPPERDYPALLRRLASTLDVTFLNHVDDAELPALYRRARVVVLPSVHTTCYGKHIAIPELLGLTLLEAMASGTPVIASNVGGLPEVVVDGATGFIVEPGDVETLRERLELLLGDDLLARQMGDNARAHVEEKFTWDRSAERCLAVYEGLIGAE